MHEPEALRDLRDRAPRAHELYTRAASTFGESRAELEIEHVPARVRCAACGTEFGVDRGFIFQCPRCREYSGDILAGKELGIARLEFP